MSRGDADDALVAQLTEMGFDSDRAATALAVQSNDLQGAIDWLVSNPDFGSSVSSSSARKANLSADAAPSPGRKGKERNDQGRVLTNEAYSPGHNPAYSPSVVPATVQVAPLPPHLAAAFQPQPKGLTLQERNANQRLLEEAESLEARMRQLYERRLALDQKQAEVRRWHQLRAAEEEQRRLVALRPLPPPVAPAYYAPTAFPPPQYPPSHHGPTQTDSGNYNPFLLPLQVQTQPRPLRMSSDGREKERLKEQIEKHKQRPGAQEVVKIMELERALEVRAARPALDMSSSAPINEAEMKKIDTQFETHLRTHPADAEDLLAGHMRMILAIPNHPVALKFTDWSRTWFSPFARLDKPGPEHLKQLATLIPIRIESLTDTVLSYYGFLKKKATTAGQVADAIAALVWNFVYEDLFGLVKKVYAEQDLQHEEACRALSEVPLSGFDIRQQFWLFDEATPYSVAINTLKGLTHATLAEEKLSVLTSTAARVVSAVPAYWAQQTGPGQKQPDTGIGGDELLPLIAYVTIRANIPNIFSEAAFMELLIHDDVSIQQEGYLLATLQTALNLILYMHEEVGVLKAVAKADEEERNKERTKEPSEAVIQSDTSLLGTNLPPAVAVEGGFI